MAKIREVLKELTVETAKRDRICHRNRNDHTIRSGEPCLVIRDPVSGGSKNYCPSCARGILDRAEGDVARLRQQLRLVATG